MILSNAGRLRDGAQFLLDNSRFASAYALAVLSVEEIGRLSLAFGASVISCRIYTSKRRFARCSLRHMR
jgi:AbiV family abortive infection protein